MSAQLIRCRAREGRALCARPSHQLAGSYAKAGTRAHSCAGRSTSETLRSLSRPAGSCWYGSARWPHSRRASAPRAAGRTGWHGGPIHVAFGPRNVTLRIHVQKSRLWRSSNSFDRADEADLGIDLGRTYFRINIGFAGSCAAIAGEIANVTQTFQPSGRCSAPNSLYPLRLR